MFGQMIGVVRPVVKFPHVKQQIADAKLDERGRHLGDII
jgi:hypothetical protein